jgi:hypothetical protein
MSGEPTTPFAFAKYIVADPISTCRSVDDSVVADVDRDMVHVVAVIGEEEQVAWT